jgi:hypothetical protein
MEMQMQYRKLKIQGHEIRFTNAPGSKGTQINIHGYADLFCDHETPDLRLFNAEDTRPIPLLTEAFQAELHRELTIHNAVRTAHYRLLNTGVGPNISVATAPNGKYEFTLKFTHTPDNTAATLAFVKLLRAQL